MVNGYGYNGENYTIRSNEFTHATMVFDGWEARRSDNGAIIADYAEGETIPALDRKITLIAKWANAYYTVVYKPNGGTPSSDVSDPVNASGALAYTFKAASTFTAPAGKVFKGWGTAANGTGTNFPAGETVNLNNLSALADPSGNLTFYAIYDSASTTYIWDWAQLAAINTDTTTLAGDYKLARSLDENSGFYETNTGGWDMGGATPAGWRPLGDDTTPFTGTFDGQGFTISDLWISRINAKGQGLYGYMDGAEIQNTSVVYADAGIFATNDIVSVGVLFGGFVGHTQDSAVSNCFVTATATADS
jgi:hypothetical protein